VGDFAGRMAVGSAAYLLVLGLAVAEAVDVYTASPTPSPHYEIESHCGGDMAHIVTEWECRTAADQLGYTFSYQHYGIFKGCNLLESEEGIVFAEEVTPYAWDPNSSHSPKQVCKRRANNDSSSSHHPPKAALVAGWAFLGAICLFVTCVLPVIAICFYRSRQQRQEHPDSALLRGRGGCSLSRWRALVPAFPMNGRRESVIVGGPTSSNADRVRNYVLAIHRRFHGTSENRIAAAVEEDVLNMEENADACDKPEQEMQVLLEEPEEKRTMRAPRSGKMKICPGCKRLNFSDQRACEACGMDLPYSTARASDPNMSLAFEARLRAKVAADFSRDREGAMHRETSMKTGQCEEDSKEKAGRQCDRAEIATPTAAVESIYPALPARRATSLILTQLPSARVPLLQPAPIQVDAHPVYVSVSRAASYDSSLMLVTDVHTPLSPSAPPE